MLESPTAKDVLAPYATVAAEYYDESRHPTCRNFRDASRVFLETSLAAVALRGVTLEVGAGYSLLGELAETSRLEFEQLLLLDSSVEMLSYSRRFSSSAKIVVGDARELPFADATVSLLVASLADPYNVESFWREAARCLRKGGQCIFTTPSYDWATSFRPSSENERQDAAYFELRSGQRLYLPSVIKPEAEQRKMIFDAGMEVLEVTSLRTDVIPPPYSGKIFGCDSVVTGYIAVLR